MALADSADPGVDSESEMSPFKLTLPLPVAVALALRLALNLAFLWLALAVPLAVARPALRLCQWVTAATHSGWQAATAVAVPACVPLAVPLDLLMNLKMGITGRLRLPVRPCRLLVVPLKDAPTPTASDTASGRLWHSGCQWQSESDFGTSGSA